MREDVAGGCLCGEVRYRITAEPVEAMYCHCRMCQRAHGAPVIAWLTLPLDAFVVMTGNPVAYRSSAKAFRHFCGRCGTPLACREADNPRFVDISIASLDDPEAIAPTMHIWTTSRIDWFETADHLPRYRSDERPKADR
ncbi:MAG: GFA family protein [Alphaproteobacteria bacterium]|nr:GFA family protein [Alphaproteobacteria bacterium]